MSEPGDYDPGIHREHNFDSARKIYQDHAIRRVEEAKEKDEPMENLVPASITTNCRWPLISVNDVTGSVGAEWIKIFFSKFPYVFNEGKGYMGKDLRVCFGAIGDSNPTRDGGSPDTYFLQAVDFVDDTGAVKAIKKLIPECGGGGQQCEDYQLWVLYAYHNIHFPKARRKPLLILSGDEAPYESVSKQLAKKVNVNLSTAKISTDEIFRLAKQKFTIYMVRKSYDDSAEHKIHRRWVRLLGDSHVCVLKSPDRVADVYFGIMAKEAGKIPEFIKEIKNRQTKEQCEEVLEALEPIFADPTPDDAPIEAESDEGTETAPLV